MMRVMLYEAAQEHAAVEEKWCWLKALGRCRSPGAAGMKKGDRGPLARRLAVIMHRIWVDGTEFRWTREQATAAA